MNSLEQSPSICSFLFLSIFLISFFFSFFFTETWQNPIAHWVFKYFCIESKRDKFE